MALGTILGLASSVPGLALGGYQLYKSSQIKPEEYSIPAEVKQMLGIAESQAGNNMPGYDLAKQSIGTSTSRGANLLERSTSGASLLGGISDLVASEQSGLTNLAATNAQVKAEQMKNLQNALMASAGYKDKEWQMNEGRDWDLKNQLLNSGIQNIVGGVGTGVSSYMQSELMDSQLDYWNSILNAGGVNPIDSGAPKSTSLKLTPSMTPKVGSQGIQFTPSTYKFSWEK